MVCDFGTFGIFDFINAAKAAENFSVKEASGWFTNNKTTLANKIKINAEVSFLNIIADFTPVWDSARTAVDTNYYVVEAPAKYARKLGFNTDSTNNNINALTRLLVLKNKKSSKLSAVLMHIHTGIGVSSGNVHYMDIPAAFSGNIVYTTLQGAFIYGYILKDGKVTKVSSGKKNTTKPGGPKIMQALNPGECETIQTDWYAQACYYNGASLLGCTDWEYVYTTYDTYCAPEQPGGGGPALPDPDCPEGGGDPEPAPQSVKDKLVVAFHDGGDGPCSTCQAQANEYYSNLEADIVTGSAVSIVENGSADPNVRTRQYTWHILSFRGFPYDINSVEKGVHKRIDGQWLWESLRHDKFTLNGFHYGTDVNLVTENVTIGDPSSSITIKFNVSIGFTCGDVVVHPYTSPNYTNSRGFNINDVPR